MRVPLNHTGDPPSHIEDSLIEGNEDNEVYPRSGTMDAEDTLMSRYSEGQPKKNVTRYSPAMKNMLPFRKGESTATGCHRIDEASLFSFVTYSWIFDYLLKAFKGNVSESSWTCSVYDGCGVSMSRLEYLWDQEVRLNPENPSLFKVVCRFIKTRLLLACGVFLFCLVFGFIGPTCFIRGLIAFAERPLLTGDEIDYTWGLFLVISLLLVELARVLSYGATWAVSYRTALRVRGAVLALLFKRLLNAKRVGVHSSAEIVNIFANDGQRIFDAISFAPLVIIGPLVLFGGIGYLVAVIGWWALAGIAVFFLFDVIQYGLGMTMVRCRREAIEKTEKRVTLMGEIIRYIRIIKMNAWERNFIDRIEKMRQQERSDLKTAGYAQSLAIACGPVVPSVAAILTFLGVVLTGNDLKASDAFSAISVFFVMLFGIRMIPYGSRYLAEAGVALRRISVILKTEGWEQVMPASRDQNVAVNMKHATFSWAAPEELKEEEANEETDKANAKPAPFVLSDIELLIQKKELIGICGAVGSGKTALLTSIIGHMHQSRGDLELGGSVAYVPQTPWIQNATLVDNVMFGLEYNESRFNKVVQASQLNKDIELMPAREQTEIGERGATLSGGQKARVSLARALYSNRDIFLIDDVLCSVDRQVADKIFQHGVLEYLQKKTVLLVTSDIERLPECDRVVFMENGRIVAIGKHSELVEQCSTYKSYCEIAVDNVKYASSTEHSEANGDIIPIYDTDGDANTAHTVKKPTDTPEKCTVIDKEEDFGLASLSWKVYITYIRAAGSWFMWAILLAAFIINVASTIFSTYWLSRWLKRGHGEEFVMTNGTEQLTSRYSMADSPDTAFYSLIYGLSVIILFVSGLFKAMMFVKVSLNASTRLHNGMFNSVIKGNAHFFDANPSGRILNRFSKDLDEIDVKLPFSTEVFLQNMITCLGFLAVITWVFPYFLLACIPLFAVFALFVLCFRSGIRSLKRSENISRSPLFDHITASVEGITVIHSYGQTPKYLEQLKQRLDANSGSMFMFQSAMRWIAVWLDILVVAITFVVAGCIVLLTGRVSPADAGMAIAFAIQMSGIFQFAVRTQTEMEAKMTSVERVQYYADNIVPDGDFDTPKGTEVPIGWPSKGQIDFSEVKLRYRPNMDMSLHGITFTIEAKEKIGIIGRTGSGKSSLANVLYRLYSVSWGKIFIDGVDISTVGLHTLRRSMAIIPQDPVMFSGTIRYNLDPSGVFTDAQIWEALEKTCLKIRLQNLDKNLESEVTSGGENFSVGERQLFCMARALLMKARIVVLDEATASLDAATDKLIHQCVKTTLKDCTVLIIAHKLENIEHCDRVILMDNGRIAQFDTPEVLLKKKIDLKKIVEEDEEALHISRQPSEDDRIEVNSEGSEPELIENGQHSPSQDSQTEIVEEAGGNVEEKDDKSQDDVDSQTELVEVPKEGTSDPVPSPSGSDGTPGDMEIVP